MVSEDYLRKIILETGNDLVKSMSDVLARKQSSLDLVAGHPESEIQPVGFGIPIDPFNLNQPLDNGMPPAPSVSNDANTFMPLLFAAHPDLVPNYKRMAAMDDQGRTYSALEHKFRSWRQAGKKILAEKGEGIDFGTPGAKSQAPPARSGGNGEKRNRRKKNEKRDDSGESAGENDEAESGKSPETNKNKKTTRAVTKKDPSSKPPSPDLSVSPHRKAKKAEAKARSSLATDDEDGDDTPSKGKGRPRRRSTSILKPMSAKAAEKRKRESLAEDAEIERAMKNHKKGAEEQQQQAGDVVVGDEEGGGGEENEGGEEMEGEDEEEMVEMKFEQED